MGGRLRQPPPDQTRPIKERKKNAVVTLTQTAPKNRGEKRKGEKSNASLALSRPERKHNGWEKEKKKEGGPVLYFSPPRHAVVLKGGKKEKGKEKQGLSFTITHYYNQGEERGKGNRPQYSSPPSPYLPSREKEGKRGKGGGTIYSPRNKRKKRGGHRHPRWTFHFTPTSSPPGGKGRKGGKSGILLFCLRLAAKKRRKERKKDLQKLSKPSAQKKGEKGEKKKGKAGSSCALSFLAPSGAK